jgi:6-phosphogluconolactonase
MILMLLGQATANNNASVSVASGSGPRHIAVHPSNKYVYLTEELSGTVSAFNFDYATGKLKLLQTISAVPETISAVPEGYKRSLSGADIHVSPDGKFLYASNRGDLNNLVIYKVDETSGVLSVIGFQSTLGIKPRNFNFDPTGNYLLVANQDSDNISVFSIDHTTGLLTDTGKTILVPNPVCLVWVD